MGIGLPLRIAVTFLGYVGRIGQCNGLRTMMFRPGPVQTTKTHGSEPGVKQHECKHNGYSPPGH
jgi:hypothetical protein